MATEPCVDVEELQKAFPFDEVTPEWVERFYAEGHAAYLLQHEGTTYMFGQIYQRTKRHVLGWVHAEGKVTRGGMARVAIIGRKVLEETAVRLPDHRFWAVADVSLGDDGLKFCEYLGLRFEGIVSGWFEGKRDAYMFGRTV